MRAADKVDGDDTYSVALFFWVLATSSSSSLIFSTAPMVALRVLCVCVCVFRYQCSRALVTRGDVVRSREGKMWLERISRKFSRPKFEQMS